MALLRYSVLRIVLVVGAGALLYLLGLRSWALVLAAIIVGAGLSYVALDGPRRAAAGELQSRGIGRTSRIEQDIAAEDAREDAEAEAAEALAEQQRAAEKRAES